MPLTVNVVGDKGDRGLVGAERRTGQRVTVFNVVLRLADSVTPALRVAGVVDLVEDDHGSAC